MRRKTVLLLSLIVMLTMAISAFAATPQPADVQKTELPDGSVQIIRTYQFALDADQGDGIPFTFDEDGYRFTREDMNVTEVMVEDVLEVTIEKSLSASYRLKATDFDETLEYELDEYFGILERNDSTFSVAGTGTKNVSKKVTSTKKYTGLVRNDMSAIDKSYQGLALVAVDWYDQNTGQSVKGFTNGMPGPYSAVAHYSGYKTSKVTTGYAANVTYRGTAIKQTVSGKEVKVTYTGEKIQSVIDWGQMFMPGRLVLSALGLGLIGGLIWFGIWFFRRRKQ